MINRAQFVAIFEHPRLSERIRVSTVILREPRSHDIMAAPEACYEAETQIWRGEPDGKGHGESLVDILKHDRAENAWRLHTSIVQRSMAAAPNEQEGER